MHVLFHELTVSTRGRGFTDLTDQVSDWLARMNVTNGLCTVFVKHTSASLVVQENADPDVRADLERFFSRLLDHEQWSHVAEGPDDMPAHVRAALTATSVAIPVRDGSLVLGRWQALYLAEHRTCPSPDSPDSPRVRSVLLQFLGQ